MPQLCLFLYGVLNIPLIFPAVPLGRFLLPSNPSDAQIETIFDNHNLSLTSIISTPPKYHLKFENITTEQKAELTESFKQMDPDFSELQFETLGPLLGRELLKKTLYALILSAVALLIFIGTRFKDMSFGLSAVLAMLHDTIILLGSFSLLGHFFGAEIDALFVTALLTILSSSTHDTVVTFDRIRELKLHQQRLDWVELANRAVSEVLVRSINNSMTIIFMLCALVVLGASSTRWFATALHRSYFRYLFPVGVAIPLMLLSKRRNHE